VAKDETRSKMAGEAKTPEVRRRLLEPLRLRWASTPAMSRWLADYGMVAVLALLCLYYSVATIEEHHPSGEDAARELMADLSASLPPPAQVLVVTKDRSDDLRFADALADALPKAGYRVVARVHGQPNTVRRAIEDLLQRQAPIDGIATTPGYELVVSNIKEQFPHLSTAAIAVPRSHYWPTFLKLENLRNVANQIVVIAIIAVGMTLVIITGGIDLSVGSLVALSAVAAATLIVKTGATEAGPAAMAIASLAAIGLCAAVGAFSGSMITRFAVPPFIATLAVMLVARGLAFIITRGESVYQLPDTFTWLGRGADLLAVPNAVVLMIAIYAVAHGVMTRSTLGRHIYAVGGNRQAAKLSGINTSRVLLIVYVISGAMAGLGGVIEASQLKAGGPKYGDMYELYVIAAVVVGGTSLSGGEGRVFGTLIGAFIIAVIQNGMNLTKVESYTQKVVLGLVILGAVLLDMLKRRGWRGLLAAE